MRGGLLLNHASPNKNNIKGSKSEPGQAEIEKALQVDKDKLSTLAQAGSNQSISSTASTPTTTTTGSVTDRAPATTRKGNRKYGSTQERVDLGLVLVGFGSSLGLVWEVVRTEPNRSVHVWVRCSTWCGIIEM